MRYQLILLSLLTGLASATAEPLDLPAAIAAARAGNPELRSARAQADAVSGRAAQAGAWPNPELELSAEDIPADNLGLSRSKNMIGIAQTVPFPGKKHFEARAADAEATAADWEYSQRERELIRDVKASFYRVLATEQKLAVSDQLVALSRSLADAERRRVAAGDAGDQELLRAEVEEERAGTERNTVAAALAEARQELAALLGVTALPALQGNLRESAELPAADLAQHPGVRAAAAQSERARLELNRALLDPFPDFTVSAAVGRDEATDESLVEFRVSVPLPLFDWGLGKRREARALAEARRYDAEAITQRLQRQHGTQLARCRAAQENVRAYRDRILPKAEKAAALVRTGFDAGKFGFLDLVDTQRTLTEARLAYWDKLLELNLALAELEALAGHTTESP